MSQKTVPTYLLLLVCQIWTDFNTNWKDCPRINPYQNCAWNAHFTWRMCLHNFGKFEVSDWAVNAIIEWTFDASFQFVDVRHLGTIDTRWSLLKQTPHGVVNRVEVRQFRRPDSEWDKIGRLLIQQRYSVLDAMWCGIVRWKTKNLLPDAEWMSGSSVCLKRRRDSTSHWFWTLVWADACATQYMNSLL